MKKIIFIMAFIAIGFTQSASAWGRIGHDAIAAIAERNLTPKAKKTIEKYIGHSIICDASWMDQFRNSQGYEMTTRWHMGTVDADLQSTDAIRQPLGDCVEELENAIMRLKNYKEYNDSTVAVNIKYIIHLVGDMHCPSHIRYGGHKYKVRNLTLFGKKNNYHKIWDSSVLEANHGWSCTEYAEILDRATKKEKKAIVAGTPAEWFHDSAKSCQVIYEWAESNDKLGRNFVNGARDLTLDQITKAGYRLAHVLNELF